MSTLEVPAFHPAAVVRATAPGRRPLVVALHGNFDRPEWMCAAWADVVAGRAHLLCPRGEPRSDAPGLDRWTLPPLARLHEEVTAARAAFEQRWPDRLDPGAVVWVGFSLGAHRAAEAAVSDPASLPRVQLVEGGRALWSARRARAFSRAGGRAAWVCGMDWCERRSRQGLAGMRPRASGRLERVRAAHDDRARMGPLIRETFDWLVADDPRFAAPGP